jgi:hypothetical protein
MPLFSSPAARIAWDDANVNKGGGTPLHDIARANVGHDPDDDHETLPHDTAGRALDEDGEPIEPDDDVEKHAVGRAAEVSGTGHGSVPRAQLYDPQHPQPVDAGMITTPRSGALASSISCNPANVTVEALDYRVGAAPTATFPQVPLAQPAPHPARPTAPTGGQHR